MFTKKKWLGSARADAYETVIDWEAVGGAIALFVIALVVLGSCAG